MSQGRRDKEETAPPGHNRQGGRKEVETVDGYTTYGYELDGTEYATIEEAYEAQQ